MPNERVNLASRSGSLVEAHTTFQPRVIFFYFAMAGLLLTLAGGLAYQQLMKTDTYSEAERVQNQRRVLVPGPRGNIYDRDGRLLVGNKPRFAVVIYLDELRKEFRREYIAIRKNYSEAEDAENPVPASKKRKKGGSAPIISPSAMEQIARMTVVQRYLDEVVKIIKRPAELDGKKLTRHFNQRLLVPFPLIDDLAPEEYARLIEELPVRSPVQVYTSSVRYYPYGAAAEHSLGIVGHNVEIDSEDLPGEGLQTFTQARGSTGRTGLEMYYDSTLQGEPGGTIFRVDPSGYRINPPLEKKLPVQGKNIYSSLDVDIQQVAEESLADQTGAAVLMDVNTGEVLAMASKPGRDKGQEINRALSGLYLPGSTFKLITSIAGLRSGALTPLSRMKTNGVFMVGTKPFRDHAGCIQGDLDFTTAIEHSVNTYFIYYGLQIGIDAIFNEAQRFGLNEKTGVDLPYETGYSYVGNPEWKKRRTNESWYPGDTANISFGQGFMQVTPLQMACFAASLSRGQTRTKPTMIHDKNHPTQRSEAIGLPAEDYDALIAAMEKVVISGTGKTSKIPGLRIAGKTGTAQKKLKEGTLEIAWFIGFAPVERPEVAFAVVVEGDTPDEAYGGGLYAAPIAREMLKKWLEKKNDTSRLVKQPDQLMK